MGLDVMVDWAQVYLDHAPGLRTYFARHIRDPDLVDDLTADLFLRAIESSCRGVGATSHLTGYLYRSAHNAVVDVYRVRERRSEPASVDDYPHLPDPAQALDQVLERAETCAYVQWLLRRLTPEQSQAMRLRYLEEMRFAEIAAQMGKSVDAVKALVFRAKCALRLRSGEPLRERMGR